MSRHMKFSSFLLLMLFFSPVWNTITVYAQSTGSVPYSNGYFRLSCDDGLITSLELCNDGTGIYETNTIADGSYIGFVLDEALLTHPNATTQIVGNQIRISGLPGGAQITYTINNSTLTGVVTFTGQKNARFEWNLVYLDAGFYQRLNGMNYKPDVAIDIPFESFYNPSNGSFRNLEIFKNTTGTDTSLNWWSAIHCRSRKTTDARISSSKGSPGICTASDRLTLYLQGTATSSFPMTLSLFTKSYNTVLDGNNPLPAFYIRPQQNISSLFDPTVVQDADIVLSEFFQNTTYWWGNQGHSGGIWADWGMIAGCFQESPFRSSVASTLSSWIIGDDGYGHPNYAYTWGSDRGWPFPGGRDTRHFNTNAIFINALWRYVMWTGDTTFLNGGTNDRSVRIRYIDSTTYTIPNNSVPVMLNAGSSLGQSFRATKSFNKVAPYCPTWTTTTSGCTVSLHSLDAGTIISSQVFSNVADNSYPELSFSTQPAGNYYLEISNPVGTIGWWSHSSDVYPDGVSYSDGEPSRTLIERARGLMDYQENTLLGESEDLLILGANIGSNDHGGRHGLDVGSNYYDILPFGYKDTLTNINYYESVRAMADLEELLGNNSTATGYRQKMNDVREAFNTTFWRTNRDRLHHSRYIGTVDVNGQDHDYGFTFLNTMALAAGLTEGYPGRSDEVFEWLDHGESKHSQWTPSPALRIDYQSGQICINPVFGDPSQVPVQLISSLTSPLFATATFTAVGTYNPTWSGQGRGFRLSLLKSGSDEVIATRLITNAIDNAENKLTFPPQPAGLYTIKMSEPDGIVGWWASPWVKDIYQRWIHSPRACTINNPDWWQAAVGGNPASQSFPYHWDVQLQNGGSDLYESGFDIMARAKCYDADSAWERYQWILRRYLDPDRLSGNSGFYGEGIQGGTNGAGSVGWMWSEFPETSVLGAAFFMGFFGVEPTVKGLLIHPNIPTGHGIQMIGARNISYREALFDLEVTSTHVVVTCTRNPKNKTFYMTGGISSNGTFTREVALVNDEILLSNSLPEQSSSIGSWRLLK